jgi:hypothetical protein
LEEHRQTWQARDGGAVLARVGLVDVQPNICEQLERCLGKNAFAGQGQPDFVFSIHGRILS